MEGKPGSGLTPPGGGVVPPIGGVPAPIDTVAPPVGKVKPASTVLPLDDLTDGCGYGICEPPSTNNESADSLEEQQDAATSNEGTADEIAAEQAEESAEDSAADSFGPDAEEVIDNIADDFEDLGIDDSCQSLVMNGIKDGIISGELTEEDVASFMNETTEAQFSGDSLGDILDTDNPLSFSSPNMGSTDQVPAYATEPLLIKAAGTGKRDLNEGIQRIAKDKTLCSCQKMAAIAEFIAANTGSNKEFLYEFSITFTGQTPLELFDPDTGGMNLSRTRVVLGDSSGFKDEFKDDLQPNGDQAHHAAGGIIAGAEYGYLVGLGIMNYYETGNPFGIVPPGGKKNNTPVSLADLRLNPTAVGIGAQFTNSTLFIANARASIGPKIRSRLCKPERCDK